MISLGRLVLAYVVYSYASFVSKHNIVLLPALIVQASVTLLPFFHCVFAF